MSDAVNPLPKRAEDRVHNYRCTGCGGKGHNARTCGQTAEQREARRRPKK